MLPRARLVSRIRMTSAQARELHVALGEALLRQERQFAAQAEGATRPSGPSGLWMV